MDAEVSQERVLSPETPSRTCCQCDGVFSPSRPTQHFCGDRCRKAYHTDRGIEGKVAGARRTKTGASVTIHLSGPAADQAMGLQIGEIVRVVPKV
jgi:hypothetical protein